MNGRAIMGHGCLGDGHASKHHGTKPERSGASFLCEGGAMAVESANYQCPSCGGVLRYFTGTGELRCDYCDSSFTVAEVEAAFAPRLERADSRMTDTLPPTGPTHDVAPMRTYTCASCAAELARPRSRSARTAATRRLSQAFSWTSSGPTSSSPSN